MPDAGINIAATGGGSVASNACFSTFGISSHTRNHSAFFHTRDTTMQGYTSPLLEGGQWQAMRASATRPPTSSTLASRVVTTKKKETNLMWSLELIDTE